MPRIKLIMTLFVGAMAHGNSRLMGPAGAQSIPSLFRNMLQSFMSFFLLKTLQNRQQGSIDEKQEPFPIVIPYHVGGDS